MTTANADTAITDAIEQAADTPVVPVDQRSDSIQYAVSCLIGLWAIAPAPQTDDGGAVVIQDGEPVWADCPDFDELTDGQIDQHLDRAVKRALKKFFGPALDGTSKAHKYLLDMFQDLAKERLSAAYAALERGTTVDSKDAIRDAMVQAADEFQEVLDEMSANGAGLAATVANCQHDAVTLKGGKHNAIDFFRYAMPRVKSRAKGDQLTALSMIA